LTVESLHESEVDLLEILANFAEAHDQPMSREALLTSSRLERAEFARRLRHIIDVGLVRSERGRVLAEPDQRLELTATALCASR